MIVPTSIVADQILGNLRLLCAQPSTSGNMHELALAANLVASMMRQAGLDIRIVPTVGPPIVVGWRTGCKPFTLLLYHHYDVTPTGPWREWNHEPFQLAEREDYVYGRGVAHGKGPLVAHLQALQTLLHMHDELPHGVVVVAEGEHLIGSPNLPKVVKQYTDKLHIHACLGSAGERDPEGVPFCYSGSKGLLQIRLKTHGALYPLAPALSASVANPLWQLIWALGSIKGLDEDIRVNGFYDSIEGPSRDVRSILREVHLDEPNRLAAWQIPEFLFGMSGSALVRTEVTLPTCNISSLTVDPSNGISSLPTSASARLDFHLVPNQEPDAIFQLLCNHLEERAVNDVAIERIPGGYASVYSKLDNPLVQQISAIGQTLYGKPLSVLPFGLFTQPLQLFAEHLHVPIATVAIARQDSAEYGPNEHLPIDDLVKHGQMLMELMLAGGEDTHVAT